MLPWSLLFLTSHGRGYFDAFWHTSQKHKKWPQSEQDIGNLKEKSVESVKFSFYRHILNYPSYRSRLQSRAHCWRKLTLYYSQYKRLQCQSSFLSLLLSKVFELAVGGGHFVLVLFTSSNLLFPRTGGHQITVPATLPNL